ncbi:alanine--tRNA ligase [uncultured Sneathiella sp.]|jgi:alanyl-tRNA synthetase|uniref:alanine--tRNA ligase n=1 Tax=uncultured Sneathiella sp. TaxID=879315 RepID=UPI0030DAC425|tara:strand:+ start:1160 stop:3832 length:2673 start_codon:yes stop_codon:yes gene_type:complete
MSTTKEIRSSFLDYFAKNGHEKVESSPLVPRNDPTLLFTNAGMVQFKNVFTGQEKRPYNRAVTTQKCVRAGGKHNDLENVGHTARHHTFFEMLGNFSFGDYFKDEAIELAWNLLTKGFELPKDKLLVTIYHDDDEAANLWKKVAGLPDDRIIRIATSDNFWSMGDTGPCGPCSEIFYDHGESIPGGPPGSPDEDGDRFIEIWNLVFMQYEQLSKDQRENLPHPSIDTGMGLERLTAVLQGKHDNYDIDLMRHIIEASAEVSGVAPDGEFKVSHRVIADHLRSSSFLVADGVMPSNEGRGYVLRRIMRRAMRHAHILGAKDPMIWKLVPTLVDEMGEAFPELHRAQSLITETLKVEENQFKQTLDRGLKLLEDATEKLGSTEALPGDVAFKLYDTFGFPLDLTKDILRGQNRELDEAGFDAAMKKQKEAARAAWSGSGDAATETVWFDLHQKVGATEFLGYQTETAEGKTQAIIKDGKEVESVAEGDEVMVVLNQTSFYGESGGQQGDHGVLKMPGGFEMVVTDTQKKQDLVIHIGQVKKGALKNGDVVETHVDRRRRAKLRAHHSATHLLHEALRQELGDHVTQKGSLVAEDRLRFDFSHQKPMSEAELRAVERMVNDRIRINADVAVHLTTPEEAIEAGAMALFGEKYGDEVRVVSMGGLDEVKGAGRDYSTELCGGTHVARTGDIGFLKIVSEGGLASGIRRIEAVAGEAALDYVNGREKLLAEAAHSLKISPNELAPRIHHLLDERKRLERELADTRKKLVSGGGGPAEEAEKVGDISLMARLLADVPPKDLKPMADEIKKKLKSGVIVLIANNDGKASIVVSVTDDLTGEISAVDLVRAGSEALGGKGGGGRSDMAQAGGPDGAKGADAVAAIKKLIAEGEVAAAR